MRLDEIRALIDRYGPNTTLAEVLASETARQLGPTVEQVDLPLCAPGTPCGSLSCPSCRTDSDGSAVFVDTEAMALLDCWPGNPCADVACVKCADQVRAPKNRPD